MKNPSPVQSVLNLSSTQLLGFSPPRIPVARPRSRVSLSPVSLLPIESESMESSRSRKRTRQELDGAGAPPPEREVVMILYFGYLFLRLRLGCSGSLLTWILPCRLLQVARGGASPPWRDDDRYGHYVFDLGENLTRRCKHPPLGPLVNS